MKFVLSGTQMKMVDSYSIEKAGIPSEVLMERAAYGVASWIRKRFSRKSRVLCVCGQGNNGADSAAAGRMLAQWGYSVEILMVGDEEKATPQMILQKKIAENGGVCFRKEEDFGACEVIVDGLFGIGLSRPLEGPYAKAVEGINSSGAFVVSVDIPSGIHATTGEVLGCSVKACTTVTFGNLKTGLLLYPGASYAGKVVVKDAGFLRQAYNAVGEMAFTYTKKDLKRLASRPAWGNKGTFGKTLVVAGSREISGAACFSALAAYRSGCGLVKVLTHEKSGETVKKIVPEAFVETYNDSSGEDVLKRQVLDGLAWCDMAILGPGLSKSAQALALTELVIKHCTCPLICDADGLNLLAQNPALLEKKKAVPLIVTPHMGEMARLRGCTIDELKKNPVESCRDYALRNQCICVLKDARTVAASPQGEVYINTSGNSGMAKGGSGDVLTGILAGVLANDRAAGEPLGFFESVCMAVYIHGLAGDESAGGKGEYGMIARDIIEHIPGVMRKG